MGVPDRITLRGVRKALNIVEVLLVDFSLCPIGQVRESTLVVIEKGNTFVAYHKTNGRPMLSSA